MIGDEIFSKLHIVIIEFHLKFENVLEIELLDGNSLIDFSLFLDSVFSTKWLWFYMNKEIPWLAMAWSEEF